MLKTIADFGTEIEAELARGKLEAEGGVEAFVFKDDCGGMRPHMQLTAGVRLKVDEEDFEAAREILGIQGDVEQPVGQEEVDQQEAVRKWLRRSRGWMLVGFAVIPGWFCFPISLYCSIEALRFYKRSGSKDGFLKNQILRIRIVAAIFSALYAGAFILYTAALV